MSLSIALTTMNRFDFTVKAIENVLDDDRIDEVIIKDDASTDGSFMKLAEYFRNNDKVILSQHYRNIGMQANKASAVAACKNELVCLWDSDNEFDKSYIDALYEQDGIFGCEDTIWIPEAADPNFDFTRYIRQYITIANAPAFMHDPQFRCLLNCCNYVVPKSTYLKVYQYDPEIKATDTIAFALRWLKAGNNFYVVPRMRYMHRVHKDSGFLQDTEYNMAMAHQIETLISQL